MNQRALRGTGNSYADEILYHAGISPFSVPNAIPPVGLQRLTASPLYLETDQRYHLGKQVYIDGELKDFMTIHSRALNLRRMKKPLRRKIGGKTIYYTDEQDIV